MDRILTLTPTLDTNAYSAGDTVGADSDGNGLWMKALDHGGGVGALHSLTLIDRENQKAALDILFFNDEPTGATITDNAAFDWGAGNAEAKCIGRLRVAAADYITYDSKAVATLSAIGINLEATNAKGRVYVVIVAVGTPTYAAGSLTFHFGILKQ